MHRNDRNQPKDKGRGERGGRKHVKKNNGKKQDPEAGAMAQTQPQAPTAAGP